MERINYAAGSVLTGDRIAHAIVAYGKALAKNDESDTVAFPVLLETGDVAMAEILVGPASQVLNVPEHTDHDDISDDDLVASLQRKTDALGLSRPETATADDVQQRDSYDY